MKVYILGPMRGFPYFNFDAFDKMESRLRVAGHEPVNPAQLDREAGFNPYGLPADHDWTKIPASLDLQQVIDRDIKALRGCHAYVALPGWEKSTGAQAEKPLLDWQGATRLDPENAFLPWDSGSEACTLPTPAPSGEVRITDPKTGGQKGQKLARFDLIPGEALWALAEVYGRGAKKYADDNWRKGYSWKLSFGALNRHLWLWWSGEEIDQETGAHHLAQVAWHAFTLFTFKRFNLGTDDRPKGDKSPLPSIPLCC